MIKINGLVAFLTDIHWGKSKDSELRLKLLDTYLEQICIDLKEIGVENIFFTGDWFDNRNTINVKTGHHYSYNRLKKMSRDFKIFMIPGNHDFHLKTHSTDEKINSIEMYSEINNVSVFVSPQEFSFDNGKTGLMVPWNTLPNDSKKYDYLFGHFEWTGARMTGTTITEGINPARLLEFAPIVFTGHIHIRELYEYSNGKIYSLGCPLELDWGDVGNEKGIYILDPGTGEVVFNKNEISPKHIEILYSRIENKKQNDFTIVKGNFVKLIVDKEHTPKRLMELITEINSYNPLKTVFAEFIVDTPSISDIIKSLGSDVSSDLMNIVKLPIKEQILTFIDYHKNEYESLNIDMKKLKDTATDFFDKLAERGFEEDDE